MSRKSNIRQYMAGVNGNHATGRVTEDYHVAGDTRASGVVPGSIGRRILSDRFKTQARKSASWGRNRGYTGISPPEFAVRYTGTIPSVNGMLGRIFGQREDLMDFGTVSAFGLIGSVGHWRNSHRRIIGAYLSEFVLIDGLDHADQIPGDFETLRHEQSIVEEIADPGAESNGRGYLQAAIFSLPLRLPFSPDAVTEELNDRFAQMPIRLGVLAELADQQLLNRHR